METKELLIIKDEDYQIVEMNNMLVLQYKGKVLPHQVDLKFNQPMHDAPTVTITIVLKTQVEGKKEKY